MSFDPVPRQASEYQKGAAFGHATVMRQIDGGVPADRIQETQDGARQTLLAAARTDGEREFCDGYTAAVDGRLATLQAAQRAERPNAPPSTGPNWKPAEPWNLTPAASPPTPHNQDRPVGPPTGLPGGRSAEHPPAHAASRCPAVSRRHLGVRERCAEQ